MRQIAIDALSANWQCAVADIQTVADKPGRRCFRAATDRGDLFVKAQELADGADDDIIRGQRIQRHLAARGVPTSEVLIGRNGLGHTATNGCVVAAERWLAREELQPNPALWGQLGQLCGRLHALPVAAELRDAASRLDPLQNLGAVQARLAGLIETLPDRYRPQAEEYLAGAGALGDFAGLPRAFIHSDLTWDNVILHRGELVLIDLEGAGVAPALMDLVEVTTKLCTGESASGPIDVEATGAFYRGYRRHRTLADAEVAALADAHFFQEIYYLVDSLGRGDFDYLRRMEARLTNYRTGALAVLAEAAVGA